MILTLLNDKIVWRILLFISYSKGRGYKFSEFKENLNLNNSSLYKALDKLEFYKIIKKKKTIYKIDFNNQLSEKIFEIIEFDKQKFNNLDQKALEIIFEFISEINQKIEIKNIILFGSYVKKTNTKNSDIDIAIISKEKIDLFEIAYKIEEKYNKKIELHYFSESDFKKTKSKLIEEIKRDGIYIV